MSNLIIVRSTELVIALAFLAALFWIVRQRNPLYLGAMVAGCLCFVFDWAWCARSFFNATFNVDLLPLPGLTTQGVFYPLVLPAAWGLSFGLLTILLVMAIGGLGITAMECLLVRGLHIYTYHQKSEYLIGSVPWSNVLLSGNIQLLCYLFFRNMQRWADLPERPGFDLAREITWKGLLMGALPLWGAFVIAYVIQLFWYGSVEPWIESGRPF